jgi:hypothetical protein
MEVDGRKIVIIAKDDQCAPDLAKSADAPSPLSRGLTSVTR